MRIASVRAIIEYNGKYLLVRQKSNNGTFWCLPGGGVESGEDILSALQRELIEETGIEPAVGNLLFIHQIKEPGGYGNPGFYFHVKNFQDYLHIQIDATTHGNIELLEIGFVDVDSVHVLPVFLKKALPRLAEAGFNMPTQIKLSVGEE